MRLLTGVVVALSLALSIAPAYASAPGSNAPDAGVICLHDAGSQGSFSGHAPVSDHARCGGMGAGHESCVAHAGCLTFTLPAAPPEFTRSGAAQWAWPNTGRHAGVSILPATPPPRNVA